MLVLILGSKKYVFTETKKPGCNGCAFKIGSKEKLDCRLRKKEPAFKQICCIHNHECFIWKKV